MRRLLGQQVAFAQHVVQIADAPARQARESRGRQRVAVAQVDKQVGGVEVLGEREVGPALRERCRQGQPIEAAGLGRLHHLMPGPGLKPDLDAELVPEEPQVIRGKSGDLAVDGRDHPGRPVVTDAQHDARMGGEPGPFRRAQQVRRRARVSEARPALEPTATGVRWRVTACAWRRSRGPVPGGLGCSEGLASSQTNRMPASHTGRRCDQGCALSGKS